MAVEWNWPRAASKAKPAASGSPRGQPGGRGGPGGRAGPGRGDPQQVKGVHGSSGGAALEAVAVELVVERGAVDVEDAGGARQVPVRFLEHLLDVGALDVVEPAAGAGLGGVELEGEVARLNLFATADDQRAL